MELASLSLEGVRCFMPALAEGELATSTGQIVDFGQDHQLVLVYGKNGSGKSTIIETLQQMTTGKMPCGTQKGSTYISDPREEGKDVVLARAILTLRARGVRLPDCTSLIWEGTSSHTLGQDLPKTETLRGRIDTPDGKRDFKQKEMQVEVQQLLNLSPALLRFVIFCTRPDSHCFFAGPSEIKAMYDDLFGLTPEVKKLDSLIELEKKLVKGLPAEQRRINDLEVQYTQYREKKAAVREKQDHLKDLQMECQKANVDKKTAEKDLTWAKEVARLRNECELQSKAIEINKGHITQELSADEIKVKRSELSANLINQNTDAKIQELSKKIEKCEGDLKSFDQATGKYEAECNQHKLKCKRMAEVAVEIACGLDLKEVEPSQSLVDLLRHKVAALEADTSKEMSIGDDFQSQKTELDTAKCDNAVTVSKLAQYSMELNDLQLARNKAAKGLAQKTNRLLDTGGENLDDKLSDVSAKLAQAVLEESTLDATISHLHRLIDELSEELEKCPMCRRSFDPENSVETKQAIINWHKDNAARLESKRNSGELSTMVARLTGEMKALENLKEMRTSDAIAEVNYTSRCNELKGVVKNLKDNLSKYEEDIAQLEEEVQELEIKLQEHKQKRVAEIAKLTSWKVQVEQHINEVELSKNRDRDFLQLKKINLTTVENFKNYKSSLKNLEEQAAVIMNLNANSAVLDGHQKLEKLSIKLKGHVPEEFCIEHYEKAVHDALKKLHEIAGVQSQLQIEIKGLEKELNGEYYKSVEKYREEEQELTERKQKLRVTRTEITEQDEKILSAHQEYVSRINAALREKWRRFYAGRDIEYIEIRSDSSSASLNQDENTPSRTDQTDETKFRKVYNYRVVKCCNGVETNMRDACSSGQMEIACLLIRLVLAEMLAAEHLNVIALDDPSCTLDSANEDLLVTTLARLVSAENSNLNPDHGRLQLIVASQSREFVRKLAQATSIPHYTHVERCERYSTIRQRVIAFLDDVGPAAPAQDPGPEPNVLAELGVDESDGSPTQKRRRVQPD